MAASLASAAVQVPVARAVRIIHGKQDWAAIAAPWAVLLQAGEVLAPGAAAAFAREAAANGDKADCITADCDRMAADGTRRDPLFKPGPDPVLLRSGLPVRGACAHRWRTFRTI